MEENEQNISVLIQSDLQAISYILSFYERHLWNIAAPSAKRTRQITEIQFLVVKVLLLPATLSATDISYIEAALSTFMKQAKERIQQSKSRDEILESCEILHTYFIKVLAATH